MWLISIWISISTGTYKARVRRSSAYYPSEEDVPPSVDPDMAEKKILEEYGPKACVIEEPCKAHALRPGQMGAQPDWNDILRWISTQNGEKTQIHTFDYHKMIIKRYQFRLIICDLDFISTHRRRLFNSDYMSPYYCITRRVLIRTSNEKQKSVCSIKWRRMCAPKHVTPLLCVVYFFLQSVYYSI